jgi:hypothetical protein
MNLAPLNQKTLRGCRYPWPPNAVEDRRFLRPVANSRTLRNDACMGRSVQSVERSLRLRTVSHERAKLSSHLAQVGATERTNAVR